MSDATLGAYAVSFASEELAAEFLREFEHPVPDLGYLGHLHEELSKKVGRS